MRLVREILKAKGSDIWSVTPDTPIYKALQLMAEKNIGALVVVEAGRLVGIMSERDYARKVVLQGKSSMDTPVSDIMTSKVVIVRPDQTIDECMNLMTEKRFRHLPVLDNDQLVGLISIGDVVKAIISEQEIYIRDLHNYIEGRVYGM